MLRKIAFAVLASALAGAVGVPAAAAEQLHANVVSWSPNDVQMGEPVSVLLVVYTLGSTPYPADGRPKAGVNRVEVVIRGEGEVRRFATKDLGSGRYGAEITFPRTGGWDVRVSYGAGSYGAGDEILLGKGAICVGRELCVGRQPEQRVPARRGGRLAAALGMTLAGVSLVTLAAAAGVIRGAGS